MIKIIIPFYNTISTIVFESRETLWIALYFSGLIQRNTCHKILLVGAVVQCCCFQEYIVSGAPDGGVPQNICSAEGIQLAGKLIIATDFSWEFRTFSSISSRAGWIF